jgi:hypothetical protein
MSSYNERKQNGDGTYSALQHLTGSDMILPVDIQSKLAQTIQTHNAVSVGATNGSSAQTSFMDCDGFDKLAITVNADATIQFSATITWSNDGTSIHGVETILAQAAGQSRAGILDIKARYAKVTLFNFDAAAHTVSAWAYLKA